jgi:uncharacterized OB-fold protein
MASHARPIPTITPEMRPFFAAAKRRELAVQRCAKCGALRFPARPLCSHCLSRDSEWVAVSGRGEVFSYGIMHQVYHPGFADAVPYAVVVVRLDEGVKMVSNLVGVPTQEVAIGIPVRVVFEDITEEVTLPKFTPA